MRCYTQEKGSDTAERKYLFDLQVSKYRLVAALLHTEKDGDASEKASSSIQLSATDRLLDITHMWYEYTTPWKYTYVCSVYDPPPWPTETS